LFYRLKLFFCNTDFFFLIILGAVLFITAPTYLSDLPELGFTAIIFGFLVGGLGFYLNFFKRRKKEEI